MADLGVAGQHGVNDPSQQPDYSLGGAADDAQDNGDTGKKRKFQNNTGGDEDEDDDEKGGRERRKIDIKFIQDKSRRHITFSKRKAGIMKKVSLLHARTKSYQALSSDVYPHAIVVLSYALMHLC